MKITEKVSPMHPDKIADVVAGALVDYCYAHENNPKCAFEVLVGHGNCVITAETSVTIPLKEVKKIVSRITRNKMLVKYIETYQDPILSSNQLKELRCGDNGVFAGYPMPKVHKKAIDICKRLFDKYPYDGKIVVNEESNDITVCWSNTSTQEVLEVEPRANKVNPLGFWTGGVEVDTGVTGRKLASDFYGITKPLGGGNMHGKDLSKADVSVNIYCYLMAKESHKEVKAICSIGDKKVLINNELVPFSKVVKAARKYIKEQGGFEEFAKWGLC